MVTKFTPKALELDVIHFDGTHSSALFIQDAVPQAKLDIVYDYGTTKHKLRMLVDQRYVFVTAGNYVVCGPLGELFIYRKNVFEAMFDRVFQEP